MRKQIIIEYHWERSDGGRIEHDHAEALEEAAEKMIFDQVKQGYTAGELNETNEGVDYTGWWERTTNTL